MLLAGKEKFEIGVPIFNCSEFLLKGCEPAGDQMQIFQTQPLPFFSRTSHQSQSGLVLPTSHRQLQIVLSAYCRLTIFLQLLGRVVTSRNDEQSWYFMGTLLLSDVFDGDISATYTGHPQDLACEVDQSDLEFLRPEHVNQQYFLQFCQFGAG